MIELLTNIWFLIFTWAILTTVAATVAQAWQKVRKAQVDAALKQEMLQRGLSVEEIARVLNPKEMADAALKKEMLERGLSVEEMERVLKPPKAPEAPLSEDATYRELGACLATQEIPGPALGEIIAAFRALELPAKRALVHMLKGIVDGGGDLGELWLLAMVRGLRSFPDAPPARAASEQFATRPVP
jgi:hypothetical protein